MSNVPFGSFDGTVQRTTDGGVIRFERHLPFPAREVWDAITMPARLADWWLPFEADITIDLREGGLMVINGRGEESASMTFTIQRVEPPLLLEHTHIDPESYMRWELEPVHTGCVLRVTHFVTDPDAAIGRSYIVGLHTSLGRLEPCLAGRPVPWDWEVFATAQAHYASVGLAPPVDAT